jgi:hypothetical protein
MQRKDSFEVTVTKTGFVAQSIKVESRSSSGGAAGIAGNVLVGGIIGMGIDASSGAMNNLTPNPLRATLAPQTENATAVASPSKPEQGL